MLWGRSCPALPKITCNKCGKQCVNKTQSVHIYGILDLQSLTFCQTSSMKLYYYGGRAVTVSGQVQPSENNIPAKLELYSDRRLIGVSQVLVTQDGKYSHTFIEEGMLWGENSEYEVNILYAESQLYTNFSFFPNPEMFPQYKDFKIDRGEYGEHYIKYKIYNASLDDISLDPNGKSFTVKINATDKGAVSLDIPRNFMGAKKYDNQDGSFTVLVNERQAPYMESIAHVLCMS